MFHILALAAVAVDGEKIGWLKGLLQTVALHGLGYAQAHPIYTGLAMGAVGMVVVGLLRRAMWTGVKWTVGFPIVLLKHAARPVLAICRAVRNRTRGQMALRRRLPFIGEVASIGPCEKCGTREQHRVRCTAMYGGKVRGINTMSGAHVLGCPDCTMV